MPPTQTEELTRMLLGAALSRALCTVAELGVADQIEEGRCQPVSELAARTGAHERSLYRLLRYLASHGVFQEKEKGSFAHTPLSGCLKSETEGSFRPAARMFHHLFPAWEGLHQAALTGESGFSSVYGRSLFEYVGEQEGLAPLFDAGMTSIHGHETEAMLEAYDFGETRVLADIGGGNGSLICAVLRRYPHMQGILFDLEHVTERTRRNLEEAGLTSRCSVVQGSFFEALPEGADTYLFRHIIHDWTDEQSQQILRRCRSVMPPEGKLLVVEFVIPPGDEPCLAKEADMAMMVFPGGMERTLEEYEALFREAGFRLSRVTPTDSAVSVVEGRPV